MLTDQEAKLVLQRMNRPVEGLGEEKMIFYFKLKKNHISFGKIRL